MRRDRPSELFRAIPPAESMSPEEVSRIDNRNLRRLVQFLRNEENGNSSDCTYSRRGGHAKSH